MIVETVRALFRFQRRTRRESEVIVAPGLRIDRSRYVVYVHDEGEQEKVDLPHKQFELLYHLASHPGQVFTRCDLLKAIWENTEISIRTVDVHVRKIRRTVGA